MVDLSDTVKTLMSVRDRYAELVRKVGEDRNTSKEQDAEDDKEIAFVTGIFDAIIIREMIDEKRRENGTT